MSRKKTLIIISIWVFIIASLSIIDPDKLRVENVVEHFPEEGDNFRTPENPSVYLYRKGKKHRYISLTAYYMYANPEIGTPYDEGGILFVSDSIDKLIPEGPVMKGLPQKFEMISPGYKKQMTLKEYIFSFDKFYHAFFYGMLSVFVFAFFKSNKYRSAIIVGLACFTSSVLMEAIQHSFANGRVFSWLDIRANAIGVVIATLFCFAYIYRKQKTLRS